MTGNRTNKEFSPTSRPANGGTLQIVFPVCIGGRPTPGALLPFHLRGVPTRLLRNGGTTLEPKRAQTSSGLRAAAGLVGHGLKTACISKVRPWREPKVSLFFF